MKILLVFVLTTAICYGDPNVQRAFIDSGLVPDIFCIPPKEFLQVKILRSVFFILLRILFSAGNVSKWRSRWPGKYLDTNTNKGQATGGMASEPWSMLHSGDG